MQTMTREDRILQRWQSQRTYYSKQAGKNKLWHQSLQVFVGIAAIAVTVILLFPNVPNWLPAIISAMVAGAAVLENVYRYGENWRNFRLVSEALKREKALLDAGVGEYKGLDMEAAYSRFAGRVETLISEEVKVYFPPTDSEQKGTQQGQRV